MSYDLIYTDKAKKQLKKFDRDLQERILNSLQRCRIRPHSYVKKLVGNPYFRLRVGELRVIVDIKDNKLLILVLEVDHRKRIYKN
ncbi:MAG: type II toxin-antitoxin system RelE/ParE family toxin [Candidatus Woesearchaeota archaeon]|jgi:mRNA interferase RelE/StbE|nr:type II toxin-antitoxin system RelE/ParE family toxin [Candidatus Woesearchaeota archaeon]